MRQDLHLHGNRTCRLAPASWGSYDIPCVYYGLDSQLFQVQLPTGPSSLFRHSCQIVKEHLLLFAGVAGSKNHWLMIIAQLPDFISLAVKIAVKP